jgi:hypothetical protein
MALRVEYLALISSKQLSEEGLIENIQVLFSSLNKFKFSMSTINRQSFSTTITWNLQKIAIECELDWQNRDVFIFVVMLEGGKLPNGYYISKKHRSRYYLEELAKNWNVDPMLLTTIFLRHKNKKKENSLAEMLVTATTYKKLLDACIQRLVFDENLIFDT